MPQVQTVGNDPPIALRSYPQLNRRLIRSEGTPNPQEYMVAGKVDPQVIDDLAAWIETPAVQ